MPDSLLHPIREDFLSGMSYVAIGQKYGIDQRTAKRYAFHNLPMDNLQQRPFQSKLDDFRLVISTWLKDGKIPSAIIHDKLVEMGCICSYTTVNDYVQKTLHELEGDEWNPVEAPSKNRIRSLKSEAYRKRQLQKINSEKARIMYYK